MSADAQLLFEVVARVQDQATAGLRQIEAAYGRLAQLRDIFKPPDAMAWSQGLQGASREVDTFVQRSRASMEGFRRDTQLLADSLKTLSLPGVRTDEMARVLQAQRERVTLTAEQARNEKAINDVIAQREQIQQRLTTMLGRAQEGGFGYKVPGATAFVGRGTAGALPVIPVEVEQLVGENARLTAIINAYRGASGGPSPGGPLALSQRFALAGLQPMSLYSGGPTGAAPGFGGGGGVPGAPGFAISRTVLREINQMAGPLIGAVSPEMGGALAAGTNFLRFGASEGLGALGFAALGGVAAGTVVLTAYLTAVNRAAEVQVAFNQAVRSLDVGALRSQLAQVNAELDFYAERAKHWGGGTVNWFARGVRESVGPTLEEERTRRLEAMGTIMREYDLPIAALRARSETSASERGLAGAQAQAIGQYAFEDPRRIAALGAAQISALTAEESQAIATAHLEYSRAVHSEGLTNQGLVLPERMRQLQLERDTKIAQAQNAFRAQRIGLGEATRGAVYGLGRQNLELAYARITGGTVPPELPYLGGVPETPEQVAAREAYVARVLARTEADRILEQSGLSAADVMRYLRTPGGEYAAGTAARLDEPNAPMDEADLDVLRRAIELWRDDYLESAKARAANEKFMTEEVPEAEKNALQSATARALVEAQQQRAEREAGIRVAGAGIDLALTRGDISATEGRRRALGAQAEQLGVLADQGAAIEGVITRLSESRYANIGTIQDLIADLRHQVVMLGTDSEITRLKLAKAMQIEFERTDLFAGLKAGLRDVADEWGEWGTRMQLLTRKTAESMAGVMTDSFFAVVEGRLKDLRRIGEEAFRAYARQIVQQVNQELVAQTFRGLARL